MSEKAGKALGVWNARRLAIITGKEIREEYLMLAYDLVGMVRARRLAWAGQLLCAEETFLARRIALAELERHGSGGQPGGIFMDAPKGVSVEELVLLARDGVHWKKLVVGLQNGKW